MYQFKMTEYGSMGASTSSITVRQLCFLSAGILTISGHAGVMLQARQLGKELYVGIHSDEDILEHKGPTVMNLQERYGA